jgi:hypothetical protein
MTEKEFVTWFKGFVAAANTYNITPKQWDTICEHLEKVNANENRGGYTISLRSGEYGTTTTTSEKRGDVTYKNDNYETKTILND